jgi:hypothetical protein
MISQKSFFVEPSGTVLLGVGLITFDSLERGLGVGVNIFDLLLLK